MTRITVDATLARRLREAGEEVELYDDSGQPLGKFTPAEPDLAELYRTLQPTISEEELQRRINSDEPRSTTAEVLARLEKLG